MADTVTRYEEKASSVGSQAHAAHPDTTFTAATVLVPHIALRDQGTGFSRKAGHYLLLIDINPDNQTSVVEEIAVTPESAVHDIANLCQGGSLQNGTPDKVLRRGVVAGRSVDKDGVARHVLQSVYVDAVEVIDTVVGPGIAGSPIVGDIGLGKEIRNVRARVYHWCPDDADRVGNVRASNIRL